MTSDNSPLQLSLGVDQPHNNRTLFSDHYLAHLLPAERFTIILNGRARSLPDKLPNCFIRLLLLVEHNG